MDAMDNLKVSNANDDVNETPSRANEGIARAALKLSESDHWKELAAMAYCPICMDSFATKHLHSDSPDELLRKRAPLSSGNCTDVICYECVERWILEKSIGKVRRVFVDCPLCSAQGAFSLKCQVSVPSCAVSAAVQAELASDPSTKEDREDAAKEARAKQAQQRRRKERWDHTAVAALAERTQRERKLVTTLVGEWNNQYERKVDQPLPANIDPVRNTTQLMDFPAVASRHQDPRSKDPRRSSFPHTVNHVLATRTQSPRSKVPRKGSDGRHPNESLHLAPHPTTASVPSQGETRNLGNVLPQHFQIKRVAQDPTDRDVSVPHPGTSRSLQKRMRTKSRLLIEEMNSAYQQKISKGSVYVQRSMTKKISIVSSSYQHSTLRALPPPYLPPNCGVRCRSASDLSRVSLFEENHKRRLDVLRRVALSLALSRGAAVVPRSCTEPSSGSCIRYPSTHRSVARLQTSSLYPTECAVPRLQHQDAIQCEALDGRLYDVVEL